MPKKVTIQDISRESGVSPSTVSRVLTGRVFVSEEKRQAVEQAIARLNYRPSHLARSLRTAETFSVGLLLNEITNPFYSAVAVGVEQEANTHGYSLILCNNNEDPEREVQYLHVLQDKHVDGIILGPTGQNIDTVRDLAAQIPLVLVDRQLPGMDLAAVVVDNAQGSYEATRLLLDKGHQRIGVLRWSAQIATMAQRYAGFQQAMQEADLPIDPNLVIDVPGFTAQQTLGLASQLLQSDSPPTALFALNNQLGLGALGAIRDARLRIPDDIALIVFDDHAAFSLFSPTISVVKQPAFDIGEQAMRLLIKRMQKPDDRQAAAVVLPTELIVRESV